VRTASAWSVTMSALTVIGGIGAVVSVSAQTNEIARKRMNATVAESSLEASAGPGCTYAVQGQNLFAGPASAVEKQARAPVLTCPIVQGDAVQTWRDIARQHRANARADMQRLQQEKVKRAERYRPAVKDLRHAARLSSCLYAKTNTIPLADVQQSVTDYRQLAAYAGAQDAPKEADAWSRIVSDIGLIRKSGRPMSPKECFWNAPSGARQEMAAAAPTPPPPKPVVPPAPVAAQPLPISPPAKVEQANALAPAPSRRASWRGTAKQIPDAVWRAMRGKSWRAGWGCPARGSLAYLELPFVDFDGRRQVGEMIVAADVADDILSVFERLAETGFPIQRMELVHNYDGDDGRSMDANNTSAFNCRRVTGGRRLSEHSYGRAIDINPVQNPYVRRGKVQPRAGRAYDSPSERLRKRLGVIRSNEVVTEAFARIGWKWGGYWRSLKDYQHFSRNGR
jgi:hypothetical protein